MNQARGERVLAAELSDAALAGVDLADHFKFELSAVMTSGHADSFAVWSA